MYSYDGDTRLGTGGALRRAAALLDGKVREKTGKNDRHHHPSNKTKGHTDDQTAEHSVAERCANHCADHRAEHCADHCAEHCADHCAEHFGVLYGDTFLDIQYPPVYQAFLSSGKQGLMTVLKNNNQWDKSNILFANGQVIKYDKIETTGMQHIDYGLSILSRHVFDQITDATFDLSVVFQALIKAGQMAGYEVSQRFYAIDTPEKLAETSEYLIQRRERLLI
jgi:NDP-sugar pyrophosphorylase family protein